MAGKVPKSNLQHPDRKTPNSKLQASKFRLTKAEKCWGRKIGKKKRLFHLSAITYFCLRPAFVDDAASRLTPVAGILESADIREWRVPF